MTRCRTGEEKLVTAVVVHLLDAGRIRSFSNQDNLRINIS